MKRIKKEPLGYHAILPKDGKMPDNMTEKRSGIGLF